MNFIHFFGYSFNDMIFLLIFIGNEEKILLINNQEILKKLGSKIKKARIAKGFTQEYVAEHINISTDLLRNIENNRNVGSVSTLLNLCNLLEITMDDLFTDFLVAPKPSIDTCLYNYFKHFSKEDKEILTKIIIHIDKNY